MKYNGKTDSVDLHQMHYYIYLTSDQTCTVVILDAARCYLWLFTLYINIKIGKNSCLMLD